MLQKFPSFRMLALVVSFCGVDAAALAQTATLTITNNGTNSGAVGVQAPSGLGGNVCNPNPGGGGGGAPCQFSYPIGTPLRLMANSPNTPGIFNNGTGDAVGCTTSVCEFTLNGDSAIVATFNAGDGPFPSLTINLIGDGKGNVGTDNNQCQNFELGFSACTTYYGAGSSVRLQGRQTPGNIFAGFSGGTTDAAGCTGTNTCNFTLNNNSTVDAAFSAMASVAVTEASKTVTVGQNASFSARITFTNGMNRNGMNGNTPWQSHVPMDHPRFSLAAEVVNNKLYAFGGVPGSCSGACASGPLGTLEVFDPLVTLIAQFPQAWTSHASMLTPRESLASAVVDGRIYAIGGHTSGGGSVASMESYDPLTNAWSARASMASPRARLGAAAIGTTIYAVGGSGDDSIPQATVEAYDAVADTWSARPAMLTARDLPAAAAVDGTLYVIGGDGAGSVEAYDPATNTWTMKAPMPNGGGFHRAVALNGLIYAAGGSSVKVYNPRLDAWITLSSTSQQPNGQFALAVLDGRLFAAGGNLSDNTAVAALLANRPPETTWWSDNSAVGRVNAGNSGSVQGIAAGTATISARVVGLDTGANVANGGSSATLTVNAGGGGGGSQIFLGIPSDTFGGAFAHVGVANWGCGTFGQTSTGPWKVEIDYGQGGGFENTPFILNPPPDGMCVQPNQFPKGLFSFNHAYGSPGDYLVTVKVTNTSTNASQTGSFHVHVTLPEPPDCVAVHVNLTPIGTLPFNSVQVSVLNTITNEHFAADLPFGPFEGELPAGTYRIELSVPDGYMVTPALFVVDAVCGEPLHINASVQAIPVDPPTLSVKLSPDVIWPPNNKMVPVTATITAASPGGHATTVELIGVTHNEGFGDVGGASIGTDDRSFEVRATRNGGGAGRTYTVTYRATDTVTGLSTTASATVFVPHDQRK